jgi:FkbM family methyltransferase
MNSKIIENADIKFYACSELEKWRAETLLKKEPETIAWLNYYANVGSVFYDIGANVGSYSMYAASLNSKLNVYAFEPVQENFCALLNNILLNNADNVHAFRIAASIKNKLTPIYLQDRRIGNSGAQIDVPVDERGNHFDPLSTQQVLKLSLGFMVKELGFPIPNFVKIDVDGHEKDIIKGMTDILAVESLLSILVEFNSAAEIAHYSTFLAKFKFVPDARYNEHPDHSTNRRSAKNGSAVNCVFTKK